MYLLISLINKKYINAHCNVNEACLFPAAVTSAPSVVRLRFVPPSDWLRRLSGVFTGNMAAQSVGDLQEMEGEYICKGLALVTVILAG